MERRFGRLVLLIPVLLVGCRGREDVPYLGRWEGKFSVHQITGKVPIPIAKRNAWKGFILLYRTNDGQLGSRLQMHLENEQESVDLKGHWFLRGRQIAMNFNDIKIDDAGGIDGHDPNKSYLLAADIRSAFHAPLSLNIKRDKTLGSPLVQFGPLLGEYSFTKATPGR